MKKILSIITLTVVLVAFSAMTFGNGYGYQKPQTTNDKYYGYHQSNQPQHFRQSPKTGTRRGNMRYGNKRMFGNDDRQLRNQTFIELLAEKYTPEVINDWKKVFEDRETLIDTIRNDEKIRELRTDMMYSQDQRRIQYFRSMFDNGSIEKIRNYQDDLLTAVKYNNTDMIKDILNKMLTVEKEMNTNIKNAYDELLKSVK